MKWRNTCGSPSPITAAEVSATLPLVIPSSRLALASRESDDPVLRTGNERWVPHSSPVFGLEWDTQHSTNPVMLGVGEPGTLLRNVLISIGRDGKRVSGTSRAVTPLKPKDGLTPIACYD